MFWKLYFFLFALKINENSDSLILCRFAIHYAPNNLSEITLTNTSKHFNNWENQSFISLIIAVISNSRLDNKTVGF